MPHVRLCLEPQHDGFMTGSMTINMIITFGTDLRRAGRDDRYHVSGAPGGPTGRVLLGIAVVVPLVIYPFTYTLWLAIDLADAPPDGGRAHGRRCARRLLAPAIGGSGGPDAIACVGA